MLNFQDKISDLTVAEFVLLLKGVLNQEQPKEDYAYGLNGLANLLGISMPTAQRLKNTGVIDDAISYAGRKMVINKQMVLDKLKGRRLR